MTIKETPNKITAVLKVTATAEFFDDEASEETVRYCIEQDLEDAGFDVDVALLKEQKPKQVETEEINDGRLYRCPSCHMAMMLRKQLYCHYCGQSVKWDD